MPDDRVLVFTRIPPESSTTFGAEIYAQAWSSPPSVTPLLTFVGLIALSWALVLAGLGLGALPFAPTISYVLLRIAAACAELGAGLFVLGFAAWWLTGLILRAVPRRYREPARSD